MVLGAMGGVNVPARIMTREQIPLPAQSLCAVGQDCRCAKDRVGFSTPGRHGSAPLGRVRAIRREELGEGESLGAALTATTSRAKPTRCLRSMVISNTDFSAKF